MKYLILITTILISACNNEPYQRDVVADIIAKNEYESQHTTITIVDKAVALRMLADGGK